jgi:hypothetical protein
VPEDDYPGALSRRELTNMVRRQGFWTVLTAGAVIYLFVLLGRKGIVTWSDVGAANG